MRRPRRVERPVAGHHHRRAAGRHLHDDRRLGPLGRLLGRAGGVALGLGSFALGLQRLFGAAAFQGLLVLGFLLGALFRGRGGQDFLAALAGCAGGAGVGDAPLGIGAAEHLGLGGPGDPGARQGAQQCHARAAEQRSGRWAH